MYPHNFDEISVLNMDRDYLECSHTENPQLGNHMSYRLKVSDLFDRLSSEIQKIVKVNKYVEVDNDQIGQIFYQTVSMPDVDGMVEDLLSGNTIPLCKIGGRDLVIEKIPSDEENYVEKSEDGKQVIVHRNDLGKFFTFAQKNASKLIVVKLKNMKLSVDNSIVNENYMYNISGDTEYGTLSSCAPVLSGLFPTGNKPMGVTDVSTLVGGCMDVSEEMAEMYISKQSVTIKNGMTYQFRASDYSDVYGKIDDLSSIFTDSVDYVPYMVVKYDVISVAL